MTFSYTWFASGKEIKRATGRTVVVPGSMRKKKIAVRVVGNKRGYKATTRTSSKVKIH